MSTDMVMDILGWIIPAMMGWIIGRISEQMKIRSRSKDSENQAEKAIMEGVRSLLRCELIRMHQTHVQQGVPIDLATREYAQKTYESYQALGGNGTGTQLYQEILDIPLGNR